MDRCRARPPGDAAPLGSRPRLRLGALPCTAPALAALAAVRATGTPPRAPQARQPALGQAPTQAWRQADPRARSREAPLAGGREPLPTPPTGTRQAPLHATATALP